MKTSKIEWTEATWNPTVGCDKVTSGCKFCYAEVMAKRLKAMKIAGYENGFEFTIMRNRFEIQLSIKKPTKFFVNSMSDLFHEKMPFEDLDKIFETIKNTSHHTYQILTKREKRLEEYFETRKVPENVWLGVTVESSETKHRIDSLRKINAKIRFLSMEPLLNDVGELNLEGIHWIIVGGESGHKARPMKPEWAINIKKQCEKQGKEFFFKQWGTWGEDGIKRSKKTNGRTLQGKIYNGEPAIV